MPSHAQNVEVVGSPLQLIADVPLWYFPAPVLPAKRRGPDPIATVDIGRRRTPRLQHRSRYYTIAVSREGAFRRARAMP